MVLLLWRRVGAWRSPVAHLNGVQGVASSNLVAPTTFLPTSARGASIALDHMHMLFRSSKSTLVRSIRVANRASRFNQFQKMNKATAIVLRIIAVVVLLWCLSYLLLADWIAFSGQGAVALLACLCIVVLFAVSRARR